MIRSAFVKGLSALVVALTLSHAQDADAFNLFDQANSCTTINCNSTSLNGTVLIDSVGDASVLPWVAQIFAVGGECIRVEVLDQGADLEAVLIAPNGRVWRNDDGGVGLQPLIKVANAPNNGWYTLQLSHFSSRAIQSDFELSYGRYVGAGTVNCNSPTTSLAATGFQAVKSESEQQPRPGLPGSPSAAR